MSYPGGAPVTLVGGQTGGATAGTAANPIVTTGSATGSNKVQPVAASTNAVTQVASANADTALLAANANRLPGSSIVNDSTAILYVRLGATAASATSYSYALAAKGTVGAALILPDGWTGAVRGFWSSANGFAYVTELTA